MLVADLVLGQHHQEAVKLLATVEPHGRDMAKDLARLLAAKDESHYGVTLDRTKARGSSATPSGWSSEPPRWSRGSRRHGER